MSSEKRNELKMNIEVSPLNIKICYTILLRIYPMDSDFNRGLIFTIIHLEHTKRLSHSISRHLRPMCIYIHHVICIRLFIVFYS